MLQDLNGILLCFRLNRIALISDIEKAFLQVGLTEESRCYKVPLTQEQSYLKS